MVSKREQALRQQQTTLAKVVFLAGILLFIGSGFLWFQKVYSNPSRVFWGMMDSSLKSYGRTSSTKQSDGAQKLDQEQNIRLQLGAQNVAVGESRLVQNSGTENQIAVTTQTIGTPTENFLRYSNVEVSQTGPDGQELDFSQLEGTWAREDNITAGNSAFIQAIYGSLGHVPVGNLNAADRQELIKFIQENNIYDVKSFNKEYRNNRGVYNFEAEVAMSKYVAMLVMFDKMTGLNQLEGINPEQFASQEPITVNLVVDILSRDLVEFSYKGQAERETFSGYGATRYIPKPTDTISVQELEQQLQSTLLGQ